MLAELMSNIDGDLSLGQASNDNELTLSMIHLAAREVMTVWDQVSIHSTFVKISRWFSAMYITLIASHMFTSGNEIRGP